MDAKFVFLVGLGAPAAITFAGLFIAFAGFVRTRRLPLIGARLVILGLGLQVVILALLMAVYGSPKISWLAVLFALPPFAIGIVILLQIRGARRYTERRE